MTQKEVVLRISSSLCPVVHIAEPHRVGVSAILGQGQHAGGSPLHDGAVIVRSRCGLETACRFIEDVTAADAQGYGCVIIDEAQFLTKAQVEMLVEMVDDYDVPVIAYGLRADFQNNFFEGSQWLMAWADTIEEIKTICWCGRKATCNARVVDGRVVQEGEQVVLGGNGQYVSLCRKHFRRGELGDFKDLHLGED